MPNSPLEVSSGEPCPAVTGWTSPTSSECERTCSMAESNNIPIRLHHNAYVTRDQEKTRQFYEDVIGLPLVATWCESDELFGKMRTYCHTFYEMGDGGSLAFFQFEDPDDQEEFGPQMPASPFHHIALKVNAETQRGIEKRIAAAGIQP